MSRSPAKGGSLFAGIAGAVGMVAVLTVTSRVLGFGRWLVQSATVGPTVTGDAYAAANLLPNVLYEVVAGGALAGVVVPLLAAPIAKQLRGEVDAVASALLTWAVVALVPLGIALAVFAHPIASLLPVPADVADPGAATDVAAYFLIVFSPQVALYGVGIVLTGILQAHHRFLAPALAPIASSVVVIVSYLVFNQLANGLQDRPGELSSAALAVLAWGTTAGVAALSLPLLIPVLRAGVHFRPQLRFPPGVGRRVRALALAGLGGVLAQQAAILVTMLLARGAGESGTLTIFQYTQAVYLLPYAVFAVPLVTVFAPRLAQLADGDTVGSALARLAERSTRTVLAVALLGASLLVAVAPAVQVVFEQQDAVPGMSTALTWMAPGVVGLGLLLHAGRMLLALDRARASVVATASAWVVTAVAAVITVKALAPAGNDGVATLTGLGAAHSLGMSVGGLIVVLVLRQIMPRRFTAGLLRTLLVGACSAIAGAVLGRIAVATALELGGGSLPMAVLAALLGFMVVLLATLLAARTFDRSILSSLRGAYG
ncbi:MAG: murein biosynthesis integral membrane protein MurJ [Beutenbergiaceae bacterium]